MKMSGITLVSIALAMLATSSQSVRAQDNALLTDVVSGATCPVSLAAPTRRGDTLHLLFRNTSGKRIRGIMFGAAYYDGDREAHLVHILTDEHRIIPSGAVKSGDLNISYWHRMEYAGWATWPSKILYTDGSSWQIGPKSMNCVASYWRDGEQPHALLASEIYISPPVQVAEASEAAVGPGSGR
jgi:hypothetical protein